MTGQHQEENKTVSQNDRYIRIEKNTAWIGGLIIAALIFVSNMFGTWFLQSKDITTLTTSVQALVVDGKIQDSKLGLNSERVAVLESSYKIMNDAVCQRLSKVELRLETMQTDQSAFYKSRGFKTTNGGK